MSDHDFEKQVQQKMEQLRLRPSDAVWTKVDKRIRKERRRRRVVLWLPLFLLCVVAGGYFYFDAQSDNKNITAAELNSTQPHSDKNNSEPTNKTADGSVNNTIDGTDAAPATSSHTQQTVPSTNNADPASKPPAPAKAGEHNAVVPGNKTNAATNRAGQPQNDVTVTPAETRSTIRKGNRNSTVLRDRTSSGNTSRAITGKPAKDPGQNNIDEQPASNTVAVQDPSTPSRHTDSGEVVSNTDPVQVNIDSAGNKMAAPVTPAPKKSELAQSQAPKKTKPVTEPPKPARKPSTWSFGIVAEGGASHISKGSPFSLLSKKNNEPEDLAMASPAPPNQNFYGGPAGFTQIPDNKPADLKSGISWSAGGFVQKQLSKRISLSAGMQYSYFSMKTQVGEFRKDAISVSNANYDQVVNNYYQGRNAYNVGGGIATTSFPRPPQLQEYTNKYHFLEIPVKMHWRVTGEEAALPIIVDGGLSVAKLISTNALHYDGTNDVYYKDYDYFNKIQAGITAGVNLELFSESKHPVWIGPTIKYQLSNLITSDLSSGQHLWSFGLGAKFFLKK